jgi:hypothetical protein
MRACWRDTDGRGMRTSAPSALPMTVTPSRNGNSLPVPHERVQAGRGRQGVLVFFNDRCNEAIAVAWHRGDTVARVREGTSEQEHLLRQIAFLDVGTRPYEPQDLVLREGARTLPTSATSKSNALGVKGMATPSRSRDRRSGDSRYGPNR